MHAARRALALGLTLAAVPAVADAATITVTKHTTNGDHATAFPFTVTGPKCDGDQDIPGTSQRIDFALAGGETKVLRLCDTPPEKAKRFAVTEHTPAGWRLEYLRCTGDDDDPEDAFIIEKPSAFVELSSHEDKACVFTNAPLLPPPAPPVTVTPPVATPPAPAPVVAPPVTVVEAVTVVAPPLAPRQSPKRRSRCRHGRRIVRRHGKRIITCRRIRTPKAAPPHFTG